MDKKNVTEVVIDGKIYTLGGYESEEYLHQVASYLNNKITEMKALDGYAHLPVQMKSLMLDLNTADDYFKAKKSADRLESELADKDRELYEVRHEYVMLQVKQEEASRTIESLREENADYQRQIMQLRAGLSRSGAPFAGGGADGVREQAPEEEGRAAASARAQSGSAQSASAVPAPEQDENQAREETQDVLPAKEKEEEKEENRSTVPDKKTREAMIRSARESFQSQNSRRKH